MNLAYYVVLFDLATDVLFDQIEVGATYRRAAAAGLFAVETHTVYRRELVAGDRVRVAARVIGAGSNRVHVAHEMFHADGGCAATHEILFVHVSLQTRRAAPLPGYIVIRLSAGSSHVALPPWVGRKIVI